MELCEVLRRLRQDGGLLEAYQMTTYYGHRPDSDGNATAVRVEVWDAGPDVEPAAHRYLVRVTDDAGHATDGSPAPSLEAALAQVRWADLD